MRITKLPILILSFLTLHIHYGQTRPLMLSELPYDHLILDQIKEKNIEKISVRSKTEKMRKKKKKIQIQKDSSLCYRADFNWEKGQVTVVNYNGSTISIEKEDKPQNQFFYLAFLNRINVYQYDSVVISLDENGNILNTKCFDLSKQGDLKYTQEFVYDTLGRVSKAIEKNNDGFDYSVLFAVYDKRFVKVYEFKTASPKDVGITNLKEATLIYKWSLEDYLPVEKIAYSKSGDITSKTLWSYSGEEIIKLEQWIKHPRKDDFILTYECLWTIDGDKKTSVEFEYLIDKNLLLHDEFDYVERAIPIIQITRFENEEPLNAEIFEGTDKSIYLFEDGHAVEMKKTNVNDCSENSYYKIELQNQSIQKVTGYISYSAMKFELNYEYGYGK